MKHGYFITFFKTSFEFFNSNYRFFFRYKSCFNTHWLSWCMCNLQNNTWISVCCKAWKHKFIEYFYDQIIVPFIFVFSRPISNKNYPSLEFQIVQGRQVLRIDTFLYVVKASTNSMVKSYTTASNWLNAAFTFVSCKLICLNMH